MKSFCALALGACASLALVAAPATAQQTGGLLPLPPVTAVDAVTASYRLPGTVNDPYATIFSDPEPVANPQPDSLIQGAQTPSEFQQSVESEWSGCCDPCGRGGYWFGGAGALIMGRNRANPFWTSYETNNNANQVFNTQNAVVDWTGGWAITGGYMFGGCGCPTSCCDGGPAMGGFGGLGCGGCGGGWAPGVAFTYWGLGDMNGFAQINSPTDELSTPIDLNTQFGAIEIGGVPAADYFDNAASHRIMRQDRVNNFELNYLFGVWNYERVTFLPFCGFRYFRFDEQLTFAGLTGGGDWANPNDWAAHQNRVVNNLYGFQLGSYFNYMVASRIGVFVGPKIGIYNNQMNGRTRLFDGNGTLALDENNNPYDIPAHKSDFSMIGEIDTGFTYFFRPNIFAYMGYRVVAVSNIALSDNQFLIYEADVKGFGEMKENGDLILHGAMLGAGFVF